MRVSLPTYNALTDTNPDHFSLYTDEDWILVKEKTRGSVTTDGTENITHNLGYVPFFIVMVYYEAYGLEIGWTPIQFFQSAFELPEYYAQSNTTRLQIVNTTGSETYFKYYIFYDQQV